MRNYILLTVALVFLLTACSKTKIDTGTAYGGLSFYNASYTLDAYLPANSGSGKKIWLPLTAADQQPALTGSGRPYFSADDYIGGARRDFPSITINNTPPWTVFDHYSPAKYTANVYLNSLTSGSSLFTFPVTVEKDKQATYFLSDSLGIFNAIKVVNEPGAMTGKIKLRLVQLCPDAEAVNIRIGNNLVTGLQNMAYRGASTSIDYPLVADSTLKLRLFNGKDTLTVIGRNDLNAKPGQSYLLIFRNYSKAHQYTGKDGSPINISPNSVLDIRKVE